MDAEASEKFEFPSVQPGRSLSGQRASSMGRGHGGRGNSGSKLASWAGGPIRSNHKKCLFSSDQKCQQFCVAQLDT